MGCGKRKVIGIAGKYTVKRKSSFLLSTFLRGSSTHSTGFLILSCLKEPNKIKKWGVVYQFRNKCARLSSNIMWNFRASKLMPACSPGWSFVSLERGFKFGSCANGLSVRSKTSRDASKDHYHAFPSEKRRCCVEIGNVKYRYFDASWNLFVIMTGIDYISPT
jgi:hypothetical protein